MSAKPLEVLIACEESGTVREAFRALGHNAWSCDLAPARVETNFHIQADIREVLKWGRHWDLLIAHPPCTYLCNSGVRWLTTPAKDPKVLTGEPRRLAMREAGELFADLLTCEIPKIAIENPVIHKYAKQAIKDALIAKGHHWSAADNLTTFAQSIQPWQFGHGEVKRTCLWLRGLDFLMPTEVVEGRAAVVHRASPGPTRARDRSVTYQGIAAAMAMQWGGDARGAEWHEANPVGMMEG